MTLINPKMTDITNKLFPRLFLGGKLSNGKVLKKGKKITFEPSNVALISRLYYFSLFSR